MNNINPSVIGQGTYGCVHKPSLTCKTSKTVDYTNKVSKILETKEANAELKEYEKIANIDKKHEFYLGVPTKCSPQVNLKNFDAIKKCKNGDDFLKDMNKYSLLLMEDGGINLETFGSQLHKLSDTPENRIMMEKFWIEGHRILLGLKVFLDHDFIHHDLKPQNIVFNKEKNRLNFIDFGLSSQKSKIIEMSKKNKNNMGILHWSYPFESELYNVNYYKGFSRKTESKKEEYYNKRVEMLKKNSKDKIATTFKTFFSYVIKSDISSGDYEFVVQAFFKDYYNMLLHQTTENNYDAFLDKSLNTFDIYGVGIAFMLVFVNSVHLTVELLINEFTDLFYYMVCPDLDKRINIETLLTRYELALKNSGILHKYNIHFENHELIEGPEVPEEIKNTLVGLTKEKMSISQEEKERVVLTQIKACPEGKVLNPKTNRCIKMKTRKIKSVRTCPEGKVLNTKTNRCVKEKLVTKRTRKVKIVATEQPHVQLDNPPACVYNPYTDSCVKA
jgi:serine/threonine protein kinase